MGHTEGRDGLLPHKAASSRVWQLWMCLVWDMAGKAFMSRAYISSPIIMLSMGRFV